MHGYAHILFLSYLEKHVLDRLGCCVALIVIVLLPFLCVFDQVVLTTNCLHQTVVGSIVSAAQSALVVDHLCLLCAAHSCELQMQLMTFLLRSCC